MRTILLLALALALATAAPATAQGDPDVRALDDGKGGGAAYRFDPTRLVVEPGETLLVLNEGQDVHTFSHDAPPGARLFDATSIEAGGYRDVRAPREPGEYGFKCAYHPEMTGVLVVQAGTPPEGATPTSGGTPTSGEEFDPGAGAAPPFDPEEAPLPGVVLVVAAVGAAALATARRRRG